MITKSGEELVIDSETYMRQMVSMAEGLIKITPVYEVSKWKVIYETGRNDEESKRYGDEYNDFMIVFSGQHGIILEYVIDQKTIKYSIGDLKGITEKIPKKAGRCWMLRERLSSNLVPENLAVPFDSQLPECWDDFDSPINEDAEGRNWYREE